MATYVAVSSLIRHGHASPVKHSEGNMPFFSGKTAYQGLNGEFSSSALFGLVEWLDEGLMTVSSPSGDGRQPADLYGMSTHCPSWLKCQWWNGQRMQSPMTLPPMPRCAPRCGQYASSTAAFLSSAPRNTTKSSPATWTATTPPAMVRQSRSHSHSTTVT
eukprot:3413128-Pyramimonas_sp.AAC.1